MFSDESVFDRSGSDSVSSNVYNLVIGLTLLWGFALNALMVHFIPISAIQSIPMWIFLVGYFVSCIAGCLLFESSDDAFLSFIGYNLVVVPFGFVLNLVVSHYEPNIVFNAILVTGVVTAVMMFMSTLFPSVFEKLGRTLTIALLITIVVELIMIAVTGHSATWIDWIVVVLFCGYIGVDWYRANNIPKTVDNAVDSAASLYMDIINLFVRILSILGKK